ncbi:MAG: DUF58 domain-containing protein [Desulfurococcaceae archaeon]
MRPRGVDLAAVPLLLALALLCYAGGNRVAALVGIALSFAPLFGSSGTFVSALLLGALAGSPSPLAMLASAASGALAAEVAVRRSIGSWARPRGGLLALLPLAFAPSYVANPWSLLALASFEACLAAEVFRAALNTSRATVDMGPRVLEGYVGEDAYVVVKVSPPRGSRMLVRLLVDGALVQEELVGAPRELRARVGYDVIGSAERTIRVELLDERLLFKASRGPVTVEVRGLPTHHRILGQAEALLSRLQTRPRPVVMARAAGALATPARGSERGPPGPLRGWQLVKLPSESEAGLVRGARGAFAGARDYAPGDEPRDIHWKKSASRQRLVVKEYSAAGEGSGRALRPFNVVADWIARNPEELDSLVADSLSLAMLAEDRRLAMYLRLPDGRELIMAGTGLEVLSELVDVVREGVRPYASYSAPFPSKSADAEALASGAGPAGKLGELAKFFEEWAEDLLEGIETLAPARAFVLVHGGATSFKYEFLRIALRKRGYDVVGPRAVKALVEGP